MPYLPSSALRPLLVLCLACAAFPAAEAAAQSPVSLQVGLGVNVGSGGSYEDRGGAAADALLAFRLRETRAGTLVAGVSAGARSVVATDLDCTLGDDGECIPGFPAFLSVGALAGIQRGSNAGASARLLAGPAYYGTDEGGALGVQGRVDLATPPLLRTSLVLSLQGAVLPRFQGDALGMASVGLGLRIQ